MSAKFVFATALTCLGSLCISPAIAIAQDSPCFFVTSSGQRINLEGSPLCSVQDTGSPTSPTNSQSSPSQSNPSDSDTAQVTFAGLEIGNGGFVGSVTNASNDVIEIRSLSYEIVALPAAEDTEKAEAEASEDDQDTPEAEKEVVVLAGQAGVGADFFSSNLDDLAGDGEGDAGDGGGSNLIPGRLAKGRAAIFTSGFSPAEREKLAAYEWDNLRLRLQYAGETYEVAMKYRQGLDLPTNYRRANPNSCDYPWQQSYGRLCGQQARSER